MIKQPLFEDELWSQIGAKISPKCLLKTPDKFEIPTRRYESDNPWSLTIFLKNNLATCETSNCFGAGIQLEWGLQSNSIQGGVLMV